LTETKVVRGDESREYYFREGCYILELWNDPGDPDVSIARARVAPGKTTRQHQLFDTTERYVILQGCGRFYSGTHSSDVQAGDVVVIPPTKDQSIENTGDADLVFLAICTPRFELDCYKDTSGAQHDPET